jgi:hypothetical protein
MKAILAVTLLTSLAHAANSIIRPTEYEECKYYHHSTQPQTSLVEYDSNINLRSR